MATTSCRQGRSFITSTSNRVTEQGRCVSIRSPTRCHANLKSDGMKQSQGVVTNRRTLLSQSGLILGGTLGFNGWEWTEPLEVQANIPVARKWESIDLPVDTEVVLLDIGFSGSDPKHGFLLGTKQTLLETFDGGRSWEPRSIQAAVDEGFNYRFSTISFSGDEGWIAGKPSILLHTTDGGKSWERIPLSSKLPGTPILITALPGEPGQAEMSTEQGAIYVTNNAAYTWQAAVQETVDATLNRTVSSGITGASYYEGFFANVRRSPTTGDYVAVSSRGNFYMTWSPGDAFWMPHNRPVNRRVQNMGWTTDSRLWISSRGGELSISGDPGISDNFKPTKIGSRGLGLLDVGFRNADEGYACGGSGTLFFSGDGGKSWKRERSADDIPGNLYSIRFDRPDQGFILGNNKILLRYIA